MCFNVFKGVTISYILTFISFLIFAILLSATNISDSYISGVICIISVMSILIGSASCTKKANSQGILWGSLVGLIYSAILYAISSLLFVGFNLPLSSFYLIFLSLLFGAIGGIIGINLKR
jgi:putative membrane protein (TIGR04086 family)